MPAATSGARRPLSVAASAGERMGDAVGDGTLPKTGAFMRGEGRPPLAAMTTPA
jgi:hypothetical protein